MLCALIMAGGKGTRFWPLSTEEKPKQFLNLIGEETMIQMTVNRIRPIIPVERIFICTGKQYVSLVKEQLPEIPKKNIIVEPEGRNTTPCIALSAFIIDRYYKNANMLVLPSDHLIKDEDEFKRVVINADNFIDKNDDAIVTLGMSPTRPETGYGYIRVGVGNKQLNKNEIIKVEAFVEKPNKETAERYLKSGKYLWNGGMFLWSIKNILNKIKIYSVNTYESLCGIKEVNEAELQNLIDDSYKKTEAISIDYSVLEKSKDIYVIPSEFGWDDVGNWTSLGRYGEKDENGNVFNAKGVSYKSENNIVVTNKKILLNNVENLIVVETEDYILISSKEYEQQIKNAQQKML